MCYQVHNVEIARGIFLLIASSIFFSEIRVMSEIVYYGLNIWQVTHSNSNERKSFHKKRKQQTTKTPMLCLLHTYT